MNRIVVSVLFVLALVAGCAGGSASRPSEATSDTQVISFDVKSHSMCEFPSRRTWRGYWSCEYPSAESLQQSSQYSAYSPYEFPCCSNPSMEFIWHFDPKTRTGTSK